VLLLKARQGGREGEREGGREGRDKETTCLTKGGREGGREGTYVVLGVIDPS